MANARVEANMDSQTIESTGNHGWKGKLIRQPRALLLLLAGWSATAFVSQVFVNSGVFLDIHDAELDGALGGLSLGFSGVPLVLLYLYCARNPAGYPHVFWLALVQQGAIAAANLYHLAIGTFSAESIAIPLAGSTVLAVMSLLQVFEPKTSATAPG